ncbi:MAG TPA: DnaJ domain-containing protein [Actinomycetota bacterium]|nr:DnaJ domain-containing protein [Actinomycetota bacterium]
MSDYYQLLEVDRGAGPEDIKRAYRRLARQYHPDVNGNDPTSAERFKEINKAYSVLSDPDKRLRYDTYGEAGVEGMAGQGADPFSTFGASFDDLLGQFVGDQTSERVWLGGQANIAGPGAFDGIETVRRVYEALEQQVLVLRMLQVTLGRDDAVSVVIGSENTVEGMEACSLVTSAYLAGDASGSIGVLGPTRMDYLRAMAAVQAVARYLGDAFRDSAETAK